MQLIENVMYLQKTMPSYSSLSFLAIDNTEKNGKKKQAMKR